ncbi:MAG: Stp1/IreP family PP2C-type Ser/Thr phosphatase [Clostridia bacterium]|nr:Stp1/IreP family PP2C-type Ser/Thr phosphatase [Clostridia bacterium]
MQVGFKTDKGIYRANNEDACYVLLPENLYVVADGVGGGNSGEIASRTAVNEMASYLKSHNLSEAKSKAKIVTFFKNAIDHINDVVYESAKKFEQNTGMATTFVSLYMYKGKAYIGNVGDSRVYIYRKGILQQLTEDHTYVNSLVKAGILTREQAESDTRKNMITRAIGAESSVLPDFYMIDMEEGDLFIMCTDGLYDEVSPKEIISIIKENDGTMSDLCGSLIRRANQNGGHDNITLICLKVVKEDLNER